LQSDLPERHADNTLRRGGLSRSGRSRSTRDPG
jgi:hypothetical protein